jgi:lipopolysaccharide export system protein LptA
MTLRPTPFHPASLRAAAPALLALALLGLGTAAQAEKADRFKPLTVEAREPGKIDLQKQIVEFNGDVVVTKGTMTIRAARIEMRETPDGYHTAVALGSPSKPATFRQKRDGVDEYIEGEAERLEYDARADTVRFVNNASVRRLRSGSSADEISGNLVTYDNTSEVFSVSGGARPTAANPSGRVRAVLTPRQGTAAAAEAASAAAAAASAPALRASPALGDKP